LSKVKKNDGGHKPFGLNLDPESNLVHNTHNDGSYSTYYKGSKMKYDDYLGELESRCYKNVAGKTVGKSIGLFGGVNFNENGKIIKKLT
jgi:hypothetical protein